MDESSKSVLLDDRDIRDTATAEKYLAAAQEAEKNGDRVSAIKSYEAAYTADPDHPEVCFRLAYHLDLVGEENEALHLYEQCIHTERPHLNALLNLAVIYEDRGQYSKAERCIRQVLNTDPNHDRARLFLKDVLASNNMVIDEEEQTLLDKSAVLLDTPVTDFELSVRTRNSLRKVEIRTLGDLLRVTEAELRSFKNFGEAGIEEIKAMLSQRSLRLGQALDKQQSAAKQAVYDQLKTDTGSNDEVFNRSVNELGVSVRARKALAMLNIQTIGDLCLKTEPELMGVKNFGVTSLNEIREKLTEMSLSLRTLEA